jgi:hypothetical protein
MRQADGRRFGVLREVSYGTKRESCGRDRGKPWHRSLYLSRACSAWLPGDLNQPRPGQGLAVMYQPLDVTDPASIKQLQHTL